MSIKLKIARSQLGTALNLFIRDKDSLSVQALACGGSEIMEGLADQSKIPTLSTLILATYPTVDMGKIRSLRNQYWNAIKHFYKPDHKSARDDEELMANFSDKENDSVLFMGWLDYQLVTNRLPFEVQVFQIWWYATNENRMNLRVDPEPYRMFFPNIVNSERAEQKRRLRRAIEKYRHHKGILIDPRTETGPLVFEA